MHSGGGYTYSKEQETVRHETVVFIGIIPKHWGHFLIDTVSRLWYSKEHLDLKIVFCAWNWEEKKISGNYLEFFELLGIKEEQLYMITEPTRFDKVIIPSPTMGYASGYREEYMQVIHSVVKVSLDQGKLRNLPKYRHIYFTRTQYKKSRMNEVGEKEIESIFERIGFKILAPEKLSLLEQAFYIHNCDVMVSMTGTIPHNAVFSGEGTQVVLLNRTCTTNPPQVAINKMVNINAIYIDVYTKWTLKHPRDYGGKNGGPIWVEVNDNLRRYIQDAGFDFPNNGKVYLLINKVRDTIRFYALRFIKVLKNQLSDNAVYLKIKYFVKRKGRS